MAFAFLLSMPGAPFLYYGDEIGMRYVEGLTSVEGGYGRTGSRSPMQWDGSLNAGFSSASGDRLYIPLDQAADRPTVQAQMADESSLYHEVRKLISVRQEHEALQSNGKIEFVYAEEKSYPLAYLRTGAKEKLLVILNPSAQSAAFPGAYMPKETAYHFGAEAKFDGERITAPPCSAGFYVLP